MPRKTKINRKRLRALLRGMTDIYSPSGKEEALLRYICDVLSDEGYSLIRQPVSDGRFNIILKPAGSTVDVVFVGHVDTVPAYDLDAYEFRETRGVVKGLGTADMKGGCAAMIEAFIRYHEVYGLAPACELALVVGEEENSDGIQKLLEEHSYRIAVVGEPTGMRPCLKHSSYVEVDLRLSGHRRHASLSTGRDNATHSMLKALLSVMTFLDKYQGKVRYNIRDIHSSDSGFAVPERCGAWLDVHAHPELSPKKLARDIRDKAKETILDMGIKKSRFSVSTGVYPGYSISENWKGFNRIRKVLSANSISWEPSLFESHSDGAHMKREKVKPLILGPGELSKAHTRDESVIFGQVALASQIYYDLLSEYQGVTS